MKVAAVVLAAGRSSRMGKNKLLLELDGRTILDRTLEAVRSSKVDDTVIVLGHRPEMIKPVAKAHSVRTVLNVEPERGMTSSFQTGVASIRADAAFLILGDQLGLTSGLLDSMIDCMGSNPVLLMVSPVHEGKRGHPTLFHGTLFEEVVSLSEKENMKHLVERYERFHGSVEGSIWNVMDFDTPEEFRKTIELYRKQQT